MTTAFKETSKKKWLLFPYRHLTSKQVGCDYLLAILPPAFLLSTHNSSDESKCTIILYTLKTSPQLFYSTIFNTNVAQSHAKFDDLHRISMEERKWQRIHQLQKYYYNIVVRASWRSSHSPGFYILSFYFVFICIVHKRCRHDLTTFLTPYSLQSFPSIPPVMPRIWWKRLLPWDSSKPPFPYLWHIFETWALEISK